MEEGLSKISSLENTYDKISSISLSIIFLEHHLIFSFGIKILTCPTTIIYIFSIPLFQSRVDIFLGLQLDFV